MEQFSPDESLQLIRTMIEKTKTEMRGKAGHFLVWGWITFIACLGQFILKHWLQYEKHYMVWLLIIVGIVYSIVMGIREGRVNKVKTYVGESMQYLWMGMGISYFVLSMVLSKIGWDTSVFPFFIILYALGTFVSGNILRFKPLIVGGILSWILAIVAVFLSYDYQILMAAIAIMVSYIIPAHILQGRDLQAAT